MVVKQIYSLIEYDEAVKTMEAGADNIGLVPMQHGGVPAHRVPIERVHRIFDECKRRGVTSVAIMLTNDPDEMIELAREVRPDILHIAGDGYAADEAFAARLKEAAPNTKLMQAVLVDRRRPCQEVRTILRSHPHGLRSGPRHRHWCQRSDPRLEH